MMLRTNPQKKKQKADQEETAGATPPKTANEDSLVECASLATSTTQVLYIYIISLFNLALAPGTQA